MAKTHTHTEVLGAYKTLAIIGVKGLPPEFAGTSGVEHYVAARLPLLSDTGDIVCYVRAWATPIQSVSYRNARLIRLPSIKTTQLDALSHSFLATLHACFSGADVVWYQATGPALFSPLPRMFGKRVIVTVHTLEWKRKKWGMLARAVLRLSERIAALSSSEILAVSEEIAGYFMKRYRRRVRIDTPIVDQVTVRPPVMIRKKYGLRGRDYILYLGRFVPEKRVEWLIEAFRASRGTRRVRLVLAGGESNSPAYERELRTLAGNDGSVIFTGWVFGREKEELLAHCRCFVLPSSLEGNPTVLYELPRHTPIVVSREVAGNLPPDFRTYTYPGNDRHAFTQALRSALTKP